MCEFEAVKRRILQNTFAASLAVNAKVDEAAFDDLADALRALARLWKGHQTVDKELANMLVFLPAMVGGAVDTFREYRNDLLVQETLGRLMELYDLIEACFDD